MTTTVARNGKGFRMAYLMDEINEAATRRRLDEITTAGVRALEECAEHSAEIDEQARESIARQEAEIKAMEQERDERDREGASAGQEQPAALVPWPTHESKPRVLSFAGEDFADQTNAPTPPTGFTEPPPAPAPEPPAPPVLPARPSKDHLLSFGAEEDEEVLPVPPRPAPLAPPVRSRPPADRDDDDWSDQSWVR